MFEVDHHHVSRFCADRTFWCRTVSRQIDPIRRGDLWGRSLGLAPTLDQEAGSPELSPSSIASDRPASQKCAGEMPSRASKTEPVAGDPVERDVLSQVSPASRSLVWSHSAALSAQLSMVSISPYTSKQPDFKQMHKPSKQPHTIVGLRSFVHERWQATRSFLLAI